jgi:hypothetical protein
LKPEWWGSLLVQEKYQEEKACDKRHPYRIIIIITTTTTTATTSTTMMMMIHGYVPNTIQYHFTVCHPVVLCSYSVYSTTIYIQSINTTYIHEFVLM